MATGPLGGEFSGLQGAEADLRSEADVYTCASKVGSVGVGGGRPESST